MGSIGRSPKKYMKKISDMSTMYEPTSKKESSLKKSLEKTPQ